MFSKQRSSKSSSFTRLLSHFLAQGLPADVTPMTCLICVPKLPWSRTKLFKSPLFKQILSRCVILMHFLNLSLLTISPPSSPPAQFPFPFPSRIEHAVRSKNAADAHLLKYLYFSFLLYRLSQLCSLTQYEKNIKLYVLFNLNKHARSLQHLQETSTSDSLGDGTERIFWLFLFKI